jgi:peptide/nickel transport system permease protein
LVKNDTISLEVNINLQEYQLEIEEREEKEERLPKQVFNWVFKHFKFMFVPGASLEELERKSFEYEKTRSQRKFIRRLKSVLTILGIVIIFVIVTMAVFPQWISPFTLEHLTGIHPSAFGQPNPVNILGRTAQGRDVFGRLIFGARTSLTIALPSIMISVLGGVFFGVIAAYFRGWVDTVIMRISDVFMAFPSLVLALVIIKIAGAQVEYILMVWGILGIPFYARLIRGNVLQARELPYVQAAKVAGAGNFRIMFKHILPNTIQPIIISFTFNIGGIILSLAALSFLGLGDASLVEWGNDIAFARGNLYTAPWASLWPGFMILFTVLGFMLVGDGLRDALDPRLKNL